MSEDALANQSAVDEVSSIEASQGGGHEESYIQGSFSRAYGMPSASEKLTDSQIAARTEMRRVASGMLKEHRAVQSRALHEGDHALPGNIEGELGASSSDDGSPRVVRSPEEAPDGPPWNYEPTPEERKFREERKRERSEKRQKMKQTALEATPSKLRNPSGLQVRFRTGLIYTLITIACVLAGEIPLCIYLMVVAGICAGEFYYMLRHDSKLPNEALGITGAVLYIPATYFFGFLGDVVITIALMITLLVWYVFWLKARVQDIGVSLFGAVYTGLLLCGLVVIRQSLEGIWGGVFLFLLFLSVWANDAFAYFVGSKIGKHKLAPRTSPKKSWEGFIAGLVGSVLVWIVMTFVPGVSMSIIQAIFFGILCGLAEVLGDLAESRIKRNSGFKDSGTIMPGHGGLLDRCDSLFLASTASVTLLLLGNCISYPAFWMW